MSAPPAPAPIPTSFAGYLRSMGPGIVVVLTWLGAGDIVDAAVAGGSYSYALMWVLALALLIRWLFVSVIARFQLCNPEGMTLLEGLHRLHPAFAPGILAACLLFSHAIGVYMYQGLGESCAALAGGGPPAAWAAGWAAVFYLLVARPVFRRVEQVFLVFLGLLSVSLLGAAISSGPDPWAMLQGTLLFRLPETRGAFNPILVGTSLIGAVAGSLANLMYPYFIREKGWTGPEHLRLQRYDLLLGILVIIVLDLSVWVLGAEVLHPRGVTVESTRDLAGLLTEVLGPAGGVLIYLGIFAAVGSSIVGNALAYGYMSADACRLWRPPAPDHPGAGDYRRHPVYHRVVVWTLFSPLVWTVSGTAGFVSLTVLLNSAQVLLLPLLAVAVWILTASPRFIGDRHVNRPWENTGMALFLGAALLGAFGTGLSLLRALGVAL